MEKDVTITSYVTVSHGTFFETGHFVAPSIRAIVEVDILAYNDLGINP